MWDDVQEESEGLACERVLIQSSLAYLLEQCNQEVVPALLDDYLAELMPPLQLLLPLFFGEDALALRVFQDQAIIQKS